jgi:anti-sigma factor RsiW
MTDRDTPEPTETELALTRLADGSLHEGTAEQLRARAEASPELRARLAEQERAVSLVRSVDVAAPDALRGRLASMIDEAQAQPGDGSARAREHAGRRRARSRSWRDSRWRNTLFLPAATALAIVIVALVFVLGPGSTAPSIDQTAKLALAPASAPAPPVDGAHPELLAAAVDGIPFPSYGQHGGWRATGSRTQLVHERKIVTVYYRAQDGTRVGYSIVPGSSLSSPGGLHAMRGGVRYWFGREGSGRYVTWVRDGHTCVIAGKSVPNRVLLRLAVADEHTAV